MQATHSLCSAPEVLGGYPCHPPEILDLDATGEDRRFQVAPWQMVNPPRKGHYPPVWSFTDGAGDVNILAGNQEGRLELYTHSTRSWRLTPWSEREETLEACALLPPAT